MKQEYIDLSFTKESPAPLEFFKDLKALSESTLNNHPLVPFKQLIFNEDKITILRLNSIKAEMANPTNLHFTMIDSEQGFNIKFGYFPILDIAMPHCAASIDFYHKWIKYRQ